MKCSYFLFPLKKIYFPLCAIRRSLTQMGIRRPDGVMLSYAALLIQCVHILIFPNILIIIKYNVLVITIILLSFLFQQGSRNGLIIFIFSSNSYSRRLKLFHQYFFLTKSSSIIFIISISLFVPPRVSLA